MKRGLLPYGLRKPRASKLFPLFVSILVCLYLLHGLARSHRRSTSYGPGTEHPVEALHRAAYVRFADMLAHQSTSPAKAAEEYRRRYKRQPPPGFEAWVSYAMTQDSPIIDDFDVIMDGLGPFWKHTAAEVKALMKHAVSPEHPKAMFCSFENGKFKSGECDLYTGPFNDYMGDAKTALPDFDVLVNFLDEPSILQAAPEAKSKQLPDLVQWSNKSHASIRAEVAAACKLRGPSRQSQGPKYFDHVVTYGIPFVRDPEAEKDLCLHSEYGSGHGLILSPVTMKQMPVPIPLLSRAAPHPFSDILFPSSSYDWEGGQYKEADDLPWDKKRNVLYWAGSSTGSYAHDDASWRRSHRQRLATLAMHNEPHSFRYLDSSRGFQRTYRSPTLNTSLYDVHITTILFCDQPACDAQAAYFARPADRPTGGAAYDARFVFDIDGNSYSGRFYRLLESHSCVLKSTLFREWHDMRLVPWLHYIPVSQGLEELAELMHFLAETAAGQEVGRRIAEAGREWTRRALRPVDRGVYLYRLFLEMTWLLNETRVAG